MDISGSGVVNSTRRCAVAWYRSCSDPSFQRRFLYLRDVLLLAATRAVSPQLSVEAVQRIIIDTFLSTTTYKDFSVFGIDDFIGTQLTILCYHLIKIGKLKAQNVVRTLEDLPLYSLRSHLRRVDAITHDLSGSSFFHKETFDLFVSDTLTESRETEEILIERSYRPTHAFFDRSAIVNLTDIPVPEDISLVLSFGPKFCFPPKNNLMNTVELIDDFCFHLDNSFPIETHFEAYKQLSIEFNKFYSHSRPTRAIWLDFLHYRLNSFLKSFPDLLVTRSDKGKHTVLIDRSAYSQKMQQLVDSTSDYVRIDEFNVTDFENRNNRFVKILRIKGTIDRGEAYRYTDSACFVAQLYGLIKIHKCNHPVRPIVSACSAPGFKLAKLFASILGNVFHENGFHVKDSMDFVEQVQNISIEPNESMISFDVISMFTNLPIDLLISIIETRSAIIFKRFNIDFTTLRTVLIFILKDCAVFSWNNTLYKQKDSLAMGSPLSPILAKILMSHLISHVLLSLPFVPKFLSLYVDDSFWVVQTTQINVILSELNKYHPKINFTLESESDGSLDFLDLTIIRSNSSLITKWRPRPLSSLRLLNYFSHHEKACIVETAKAFIRRVLLLSHESFFLKNKEFLEKLLRHNSFPETVIIGLISKFCTFMRPDVRKTKFAGEYVPIKYRGVLTSRLKSKIHPFLSNARLVGTPDRSDSGHFSYLKDIVDVGDKTNGVLIFICECGKRKVIRHTEHTKRARDIFDSLHHFSFDNKTLCFDETHFFSKLRFVQCKSFTSAKRKCHLLSYFYKSELISANIEIPIFKIYKKDNKFRISTFCNAVTV